MYARVEISLRNGTKRIFNADDEENISSFIYGIMGDSSEEESSRVPTYIEASSWCPLATIGETFERKKFAIKIID